MKKILCSTATIAVLLSCSRSQEDISLNKEITPKFSYSERVINFIDLQDMPVDIYYAMPSVMSNDKIYFTNLSKSLTFNPKTETWNSLNTNFFKGNDGFIHAGNMSIYNENIVIFNGDDNRLWDINGGNGYPTKDVEYSNGKIMKNINPYPVYEGAQSNEYSGSTYICGGITNNFNKTDKVVKVTMGDIPKFELLTNMEEAKTTICAVVDNKLFTFGGIKHNGQRSSKIDMYDFNTKKWTFIGNMKNADMNYISMEGSSATVVGDKIWLVGDSIAYYDVKNNQFVNVKSNLKERYYPTIHYYNGYLYVFGGRAREDKNSTKSIYTYVQKSYID